MNPNNTNINATINNNNSSRELNITGNSSYSGKSGHYTTSLGGKDTHINLGNGEPYLLQWSKKAAQQEEFIKGAQYLYLNIRQILDVRGISLRKEEQNNILKCILI